MMVLLLYWFSVLINAVVAVRIFYLLMPHRIGRIEGAYRIPLGIASATSAMTAAFQLGAWHPREWNDIMLVIVTFMATAYVGYELWRLWRRRRTTA